MAMINVKAAVKRAVEYVRDFEDFFPGPDVRLEETEFVEPNFWHITLSFSAGAAWGTQREYKVLRIDANSGEVLSMKIRSLTPSS